MDKLLSDLRKEQFVLLRLPSKKGEDVDFYHKDLSKAKKILKSYGFIITNNKNNFFEAVKFEEENLIIIEVANTLFRSSKIEVELKEKYLNKYLTDPVNNDFWLRSLRYLLSLRKDVKSKEFFFKNKKILKDNNYFLYYLKFNPFKKVDIELLFNNKIKFIIKCLGIKYLFLFLFNKLTFHLNSFFQRKTFAIIGVDGAGKTTVIKKLEEYNIKLIYMGFKEFKFENLYQKIIGKNVLLTFFVHFCVFFENWHRYLKAKVYNLKGYDVVFDRYPKIEYQIGDFKNKVFYYIFYKLFFPKVKTILLYADSETIYQRKKEISLKQIEKDQEQLKKITDVLIENIDLNKTLNAVLKEIY